MLKVWLVSIAAVIGFLTGCYNPVLEPLPTYTPYAKPEARVVVVTPTPVPDEGWTCFTGKVEVVRGTAWEPGVNISIVGKDKISKKIDCILVLAWNFIDDIKKNNKSLCKKFVNIKDLEKN